MNPWWYIADVGHTYSLYFRSVKLPFPEASTSTKIWPLAYCRGVWRASYRSSSASNFWSYVVVYTKKNREGKKENNSGRTVVLLFPTKKAAGVLLLFVSIPSSKTYGERWPAGRLIWRRLSLLLPFHFIVRTVSICTVSALGSLFLVSTFAPYQKS